MGRKKLIWQIFPPFLLIIVCALLVIFWTISQELSTFHLNQTTADLKVRATLTSEQMLGLLNGKTTHEVDRLCKDLGSRTSTRLTVVLKNGRVIGDSNETPGNMDNHANRPEILLALEGETGVAKRFSQTLQQNMLYVAIPVRDSGEIIGVVRAALSMAELEKTLSSIRYKLTGGGLAVALIAALIALAVSRRISIPLIELQQGAVRFAGGNLSHHLPGSRVEEINGLSEAMNSMAAQLDERLKAEIRQRNEQEAVLASMIEGVIAIDSRHVVLRMNGAAADLLGIDPDKTVGRQIGEVARKADLNRFIEKALASDSPVEAEITLLSKGKERYLQSHGTALKGAEGQRIGTLIVIHDVTRLRKLEDLRRDFVANVSHELKTPITAIKGAVETLRDNVEISKDGRPFIDMASRQADRLNAIIEDLLALSRLERDPGALGIERAEEALQEIITAACQACSATADKRGVQLEHSCAETLRAFVNAPLLEQAIVNLLDNAIKYSEPGSVVTVVAWQEDSQVLIKVQDRGLGIGAEHLPRLFERFYRVDAARSRADGGTGLGLAIVKHIIQAHKGTVSVNSKPGEGSTFKIALPF